MATRGVTVPQENTHFGTATETLKQFEVLVDRYKEHITHLQFLAFIAGVRMISLVDHDIQMQ